LTSIGGYVNSSVEFIATVNMPVDSPAINNFFYSLDGGEKVNLNNPAVTTYHDYGPTKVNFTEYKAHVSLKDLPEGNHTLVASANGMSASKSFEVNSYYHITALNVLSPTDPIYFSNEVPLKFTYTGEITNAHYYLYRGGELISEKPLSGDITLNNLTDGSYQLLVFVTTQYGQDSTQINFLVIGTPIVVIVTALLILSLLIGLFAYKKTKKRKEN
jgi:hypothetical protein